MAEIYKEYIPRKLDDTRTAQYTLEAMAHLATMLANGLRGLPSVWPNAKTWLYASDAQYLGATILSEEAGRKRGLNLIPGSQPVAYGTTKDRTDMPLYIAECQMTTDPNPKPVNVPFLTEEDMDEPPQPPRKFKHMRS